MPLSGYLTVKGIDDGLQYLASTFPTICKIIPLPEPSIEGRSCRAIQIGAGNTSNKRGVLFLGGMHAREVVNPDLLLSFALKLCKAYTAGTGLTFGGKAYDAATIKLIIESLDTYVLPLINPDGREYVFTSNLWWRKNRSLNGGAACKGVDLNRNFDFLWASGIGTSSDPCDETYKGREPFSEPEIRNIRYLVDQFPNIVGLLDVHSYSEDILYPWGDDDDQTSNPAMNFTNPAYNGQRGVSGDTIYKEYLPEQDLQWYQQTGQHMRDAIFAVRGRSYVLKPSIGLYPTTGTSDDYCYSRYFVTSSQGKIFSYCIETGRTFQPLADEAAQIMLEVTPALIEFSLACMCTAESPLAGTALADRLEKMRAFRDEKMLAVPQGAVKCTRQ